MAVTASNDFLRFSAYSIKDLITRKLTEDGNFTDQIYEGSNLAILIDIVSYMYQCLIYNLNNAAAESMFSDTQIYENISRLCKFIGYHPIAFIPATLYAAIQHDAGSSLQNYVIYPCTSIDTGLYDNNGNKIYFSTVFDESYEFKSIPVTAESYTNIMLVNGRWKHYSTVFTAAGLDYETFVLDGIKSDTADEKFVANNGIQVFVVPNGSEMNDGDISTAEMWHNDPNEIFIQAFDSDSDVAAFSKLYDNNEKVYTSYLNENKTFEIKFGNGITGKKLNPGDKIHIMYLDTNGPDGYIDIDKIPTQLVGYVMNHSPSFFGISDNLYTAMFGEKALSVDNIAANTDNIATQELSVMINPATLSKPMPEQNVEDIRSMAPDWFKSGNRLITKKDYEFFLKSNMHQNVFPGVVDAVCMNNWDYMTTLYRWLFNMGTNPVEEVFNSELHQDELTKRERDPYRYLSKARLVQGGYEFVDSADANNIYLWIAGNETADMKTVKGNLQQIMEIKTMTSEAYPLNPINVYFDLSFTPSQLFYDNLVKNNGNTEFDYNNSYLEITVSDNAIFSNVAIANQVESIIRNAFNVQHCTLGQVIDYSAILDQIYQINGVIRVRTIYYPVDYLENESTYDKYKTRACDGIAFASWSSTNLIDIGDDLQINNTTRTLEQFQFPRLAPGIDIQRKIKAIRRSMNTINPVKF